MMPSTRLPAPPHTCPSTTPDCRRTECAKSTSAVPTHPDTYVDISDYIELKVQALTSHRSQITDPERIAAFVREWATKSGAEAGCAYAEAFRRLEVPQ